MLINGCSISHGNIGIKLNRDIEIIPIYRYKHEANSTKIVFMYNITHSGKIDTMSVNIEQHMQVIKY